MEKRGRPFASETGVDYELRTMVGENIKRVRMVADLSQRDLAARTDLGQNHISQMENGRISVGLDILARVARECGFRPMDLLDPNLEDRPEFQARLKALAKRNPSK